MILSPEIRFYISGREEEIRPGSVLWRHSLAGTRPFFPSQKSNIPGEVLIGDYFMAAKRFLSHENYQILRSALSEAPGESKVIKAVAVSLIKHGAFYHPMKVDVAAKDGATISFVLNGAVSIPGMELLEKEYSLLKGLEKKGLGACIPGVMGMARFMENGRRFGFFLGQWFQGFREFHVTGSSGSRRIAVWDDLGNTSYLSLEQAAPMYEQAARILTRLYDLETFAQVFPWHHAAGDFVANIDDPNFPVRLISVRGYDCLVEFPLDPSGLYVLPSLLFFFLNLSLRIRLDRRDGTGEPVFMAEPVLTACVKGFLTGLSQKKNKSPGDLVQGFTRFIHAFDPKTLADILERMISNWHSGPSELSLIKRGMKSHCAAIHGIFKNCSSPDFY